jgi:hypothetical protein
MRTALKRALMWLVCRNLVSESFVTWAFRTFDLKGY